MRLGLRIVAILIGVVVLLVLGHLAVIEVGREVATVGTQRADGSWQRTRLWVVDVDGSAWLHSKGADWEARFAGDPIVELERSGRTARYRARLVPGPHPRVDAALREKYGLADRWVRFVAPDDPAVVVVRLDPVG